jgi:antitoxin component YwqK of YwqJK toxin-antitoxin module
MDPIEEQEKKPKKSLWSSMKMTKDGFKRWKAHFTFVLMTFIVGTIIFYAYVKIPSTSFQQNTVDEFENAKRNISEVYHNAIHVREVEEKMDSEGIIRYKKPTMMGNKMEWEVTGYDNFTGWIKETWEGTARPKYVVKITSGVLNGPYFSWYPDGKKEGEGIWDMGKRMYSRAWHKNGEATPTKVDDGNGVIYMYDGTVFNTLLGKIHYEGGIAVRIDQNFRN